MTALALAGSDLELGGECKTLRSDRFGASPRCAPGTVRHKIQHLDRQVRASDTRHIGDRFWLSGSTVRLGERKTPQANVSQDAAGAQVPDMLCNHDGRQKRGQASQRFNFGGGT